MDRAIAKPFYNSKAWRQCRAGYIQSVNGLCERCLQHKRISQGKILHHKIYLTPENINITSISLNWDNLEFLCLECHNSLHYGREITQEGLRFDSEGNLIEVTTHRE